MTMAKKTSAASRKHAKKRAAPKSPARTASMSMPKMPSFDDMQKMTKLMTPQLALDVINAAIEGTARLRKRQYEAEEDAAEFQKKHAKSAAEANNPQALMA